MQRQIKTCESCKNKNVYKILVLDIFHKYFIMLKGKNFSEHCSLTLYLSISSLTYIQELFFLYFFFFRFSETVSFNFAINTNRNLVLPVPARFPLVPENNFVFLKTK